MSHGRLIVISAPSGAGKTTLCALLRERHPDWGFSVSGTTRPRRENEIDGQDYTFLTEADFDRLLEADEFVEWEWVHDHRYGTLVSVLKKALVEGKTLLLDVDVKGGVRIRERYPDDSVTIFIEAPSEEVLMERLKGRGTEDGAVIKRRLERYPVEMSYRDKYDHVVVNDQLEQALEAIEKIMEDTK